MRYRGPVVRDGSPVGPGVLYGGHGVRDGSPGTWPKHLF